MTNLEKQRIKDFAKKLNNKIFAMFRAAKLSKQQAVEHLISDSKALYNHARKEFRTETTGYMKKYWADEALTAFCQLKLLKAA